jgi:hypothetical protein
MCRWPARQCCGCRLTWAAMPTAEVMLPWHKPGGKPLAVPLMFTKDDEGAIWRGEWDRYV